LKSYHRPDSSSSPLAPASRTPNKPFADSSAEIRPLLLVMSVLTYPGCRSVAVMPLEERSRARETVTALRAALEAL